MAVGEENSQIPKSIGPYSQAKGAGGFLFLSGQIPIDPATGQTVAGGIEHQAERVLLTIQTLLTSRGFTLSHVVKTTLFLQNLNDFEKVNQVYARFFPVTPPARSTVQVAGLPKGVGLEIEVIAYQEP